MNHDTLCEMLKTKPLSELSSEEMREARDLARSILRADYYRDIRCVANDVKSEIESGNLKAWDAVIEYVSDSLDGTGRVIYTQLAQEGLLSSDNADAMIDEFGPEGIATKDAINWHAMAYHAMERDVFEQLSAEGVDSDYWDNLETEEEEETSTAD